MMYPSPYAAHQRQYTNAAAPARLSVTDTATFVPGAYAISIDAKMPEDIVEQLEENRMRMHNVLANARKTN